METEDTREVQTGKADRVYSINQEKVDEACQALAEIILKIASPNKLLDIKKQITSRRGTKVVDWR